MKKLSIVIVLVISLFLRVYNLGKLPVSLFGDEVDVGYHAWSLATTFRDYYGHFLPTYIQSLSEWRAPLEMYVVAPFVGILGPSTFSARLPMAILGTFSIYLVYLVVNLLFPNKNVGLVTAVIMALTPWHLHYSRNVTEQAPLFVLELLGIYFYLKGKSKPALYTGSLLFFILTFYTYSVANLATPSIILILFYCFPPDRNQLLDKKIISWLFTVSLLVLPIAYHILFGQAAGRFRLISIANDRQIVDQIISDRNRPWLTHRNIERIFNNRPVVIGREFLRNYMTALSPQFLFISGDPNYRQSVDYFGVFLVVLAPFLLCGLYCLVRERANPSHLFPILFLLLIPIGSSLTQNGGNHASRLFLMNFPLSVIVAIGLIRATSLVRQRYRSLFVLVIASAIIVNFLGYWYRYSNHYAYESSHVWQYGYEPLFTKSRDLVKNANRVFVNNTAEPVLYRLAFYLPIYPADFQKMFITDIPTTAIIPGFSGFKLGDRFYLGQADNFDALIKLLQPGDIYFVSQLREVPGDWDLEKSPPAEINVLLTVRDFYGKPIFYVIGR